MRQPSGIVEQDTAQSIWQTRRRRGMNFWIWVLMVLLLFAPKGASVRAGRWDLRALGLLLCVVALMTQV